MLGHLAKNNQLTAADRNKLVAKIGKDQKKSRARDITEAIEQQYANQLAQMQPNEQRTVKRAVQDYTNDSEAINTSCRNGNPNGSALNIDAAFQIYGHYGFAAEQRVVYRLLTYKTGIAACPYGAPNTGTHIAAGDRVYDLAFFSSSENRQFLINGIKNPPQNVCYVKYVIIGQGGINISGGGVYTNANEELMLKQLNPKTYRFKTADAGQAEILFPRGSVLRIESVARMGPHVHVAASVVNPQPQNYAGIKNSFTGQ